MTGIPNLRPPWDQEWSLYFWSGKFSNFASARGLVLPGGWYGHPTPSPRYTIRSGEHWLAACKSTEASDFEWILSAPSPQVAKQRGGPHGERQPDGTVRTITLRPDWDQPHPQAPLGGPTKLLVAVYYLRARARHDVEYRTALQATLGAALVEDSPRDFEWGGRDAHGGFTGRNLLGLAHMAVRAELPLPDDALLHDRQRRNTLLGAAGLNALPRQMRAAA